MTPTIKPNSQNWKGMDGAVAYQIIDRHAENWADVRLMMNEWLAANQTNNWITANSNPRPGLNLPHQERADEERQPPT